MVRRRTLIAALATSCVAAFGAAGATATANAAASATDANPTAKVGKQTYVFKVTIRNLGRADLTSPVYAVHNRSFRLFRLGKKASPGIADLAEDGATSGALAEARGKRGVGQANIGPRIAARRSASFRITTTSKHLRLSWAAMQICTNDVMAAQSNAKLLALKVGARRVVRIRALDAGSEQNTESRAHVPCLGTHNVGPNENGVVKRSKGIRGRGDVVNATQGWGKFLARVTNQAHQLAAHPRAPRQGPRHRRGGR